MGDGGMAMPELLSAALERIKQMEGQLAEKGSSQSTTGPRPSLKRSTQLDSSAEKDLDGISKMLWCLRNSWFVFECIRYTSNEGFFLIFLSSQTITLDTLICNLCRKSCLTGSLMNHLQHLLPRLKAVM